MDNPLVSIIIVNWNGYEVLQNCLESLKKIKYQNFELIIVDNGSTDDSLKLIEDIKSSFKVTLIKNKTNLGFAKANNQAYLKSKGKYLLLLNNDTVVTSNFLNYLVQKMEIDKTLGVAQPKIYILDNPKLIDNAGSFLTNTGFLEHWGYLKEDSDEFNTERKVFSTKGACMLIRKSIVDKIKLFDDDFGSYFEESDFCFRVWIAGFNVEFLPGCYIYHKVGFSSKKQDQYFVNYHSNKNRICSLIKNLELSNLIKIGTLYLLLNLGLSFYYLLKLQFKKSWMIINPIIWNILNLKKTLIKRKFIQKMRKKSDRYIFKEVLHKTNWREMFIHFGEVEANFK